MGSLQISIGVPCRYGQEKKQIRPSSIRPSNFDQQLTRRGMRRKRSVKRLCLVGGWVGTRPCSCLHLSAHSSMHPHHTPQKIHGGPVLSPFRLRVMNRVARPAWLKGGKHQLLRRLQAATRGQRRSLRGERIAANSGPLDGDVEVELLVELWSMGLISAVVLSQIGVAANIAAPRPQVAALAKIGRRRNICRQCSSGSDTPSRHGADGLGTTY